MPVNTYMFNKLHQFQFSVKVKASDRHLLPLSERAEVGLVSQTDLEESGELISSQASGSMGKLKQPR